jgi:hypothetical protein
MSSPAVNVNPRLAALVQAGVSPWLDLLRRSLIDGGELQRMIDEESLRGATSNPAIFEKAILTTSTATSRSRSSPTSRATPRARSRLPGTTGSASTART